MAGANDGSPTKGSTALIGKRYSPSQLPTKPLADIPRRATGPCQPAGTGATQRKLSGVHCPGAWVPPGSVSNPLDVLGSVDEPVVGVELDEVSGSALVLLPDVGP